MTWLDRTLQRQHPAVKWLGYAILLPSALILSLIAFGFGYIIFAMLPTLGTVALFYYGAFFTLGLFNKSYAPAEIFKGAPGKVIIVLLVIATVLAFIVYVKVYGGTFGAESEQGCLVAMRHNELS